MKILFIIAVMTLACLCGCVTPAPAKVDKGSQIGNLIGALESKRRNATYVALWTLRQNNYTVPDIDFDRPYSESQPKLKKLAEMLQKLSENELAKLEKSHKYYSTIYSPMYGPGQKGWD